MNNHIKKAICIVTATAAFVSMFGCTIKQKKNSPEETTAAQNSDGGVLKYNEMTTENGTAVYTFKYKDMEGKEKTNEIEIDLESVKTVDPVDKIDIKDKNFVSKIAQKSYQMSEEKAKEVVKNKENFQEFQFVEYIQNNSDKTMAYRSVQIADNGKNNIWVRTDLDAEFTIAPGSVTEIYIHGIADMSEYDEDSLNKAFQNVDIKLVYTLVNSAQDDIDWGTAETKTMDIH